MCRRRGGVGFGSRVIPLDGARLSSGTRTGGRLTKLSDATPPDDTGTTTFERYCYQARVAFPYVLACAGDEPVRSVIAEHFEDVAVEFEDGTWHFLQIKTRDAVTWHLSDVLSSPNGAFRSLLRSFRHLSGHSVTLLACLEGVIAPGDALNSFVGEPCTDADAISRVAEKLVLTAEETAHFVPLVRVQVHPGREVIDDVNLRRLGDLLPHLAMPAIRDLYNRCLATIYRAMEASLVGEEWARLVVDPDFVRTAAAGKVLDSTELEFLRTQIGGRNYPLLTRLFRTDVPAPTTLEEKMTSAGVSEQVLRNAAELRAAADAWAIEQQAAELWPADEVSDEVDFRLRSLATAVIAGERGGVDAAWSELQNRIAAQAASVDPGRTFRQDPFLLLGRVASLTDACHVGWVVRSA